MPQLKEKDLSTPEAELQAAQADVATHEETAQNLRQAVAALSSDRDDRDEEAERLKKRLTELAPERLMPSAALPIGEQITMLQGELARAEKDLAVAKAVADKALAEKQAEEAREAAEPEAGEGSSSALAKIGAAVGLAAGAVLALVLKGEDDSAPSFNAGRRRRLEAVADDQVGLPVVIMTPSALKVWAAHFFNEAPAPKPAPVTKAAKEARVAQVAYAAAMAASAPKPEA